MIIDTREQLPVWDPELKEHTRMKLDEGDYTIPKLLNIAHIERKSGIDLYGSLVQGHKRFKAEIQRAIDKNIKLAIFVECPKETFIGKKFKGGFRLKMPNGVLRKIVTTMEDKYNLEFVWCDDREDFKERAELWFNREMERNGKITTDI